jgi:hypothetical protein
MSLKSVEVIQMDGMYHFELQHWLKIFYNVQNEFVVPADIHNFLSIFFCLSAINCCLVIVIFELQIQEIEVMKLHY